MKNALFFIVITISFFFTSCQKEVIAPTPIQTSEQTISDRTASTEIEVAVVLSSLQSGTVTVLLSSEEDLTIVTPEAEQTLGFNSGGTTLSFQVNSHQVIGDDLEITFNLGGQNLSGYALDGGQFIIIEDENFE